MKKLKKILGIVTIIATIFLLINEYQNIWTSIWCFKIILISMIGAFLTTWFITSSVIKATLSSLIPLGMIIVVLYGIYAPIDVYHSDVQYDITVIMAYIFVGFIGLGLSTIGLLAQKYF